MNKPSGKIPLVSRPCLAGFVMVTGLFVLWGFANDITNPMVAAFKNVLLLSHFESSLVQAAFYGGYCLMAIPAALFIRRWSYRGGILVGLSLYAAGCLLFIPSGYSMQFACFLISYLIMTAGLAFLETTANPFVLSLGDEATAARRLNLAQSFNPLGSICGMFVAKEFILGRLNPAPEAVRRELATADPELLRSIQQSDLAVIVLPYALLGAVVLLALLAFWMVRLPEKQADGPVAGGARDSLRRLVRTPRYLWGVVAQCFYIGVQIMVWTFIIQYAVNELGISSSAAQGYNIAAMVLFVSSRFVCTWLLKFFNAGGLLGSFAVAGGVLIMLTILLPGWPGLIALIAVSGAMSLMFPTIYGIALTGLGDDAKLGSAGLICAIGGGSVMPPLQALIMDGKGLTLGDWTLSATRLSFLLPLLCFVVIAVYGFAMRRNCRRS